MPQGLTYTDAVKLLGGAGPLMKITDNLLGGALTVATAGGSDAALSLFDAKSEAIRLGHLVTEKITDLVRGQGRYHRSERLHAAHAVLVVSAFFASLDDCLQTAGVASPGFTTDDQLLLAAAARTEGSWQSRLLDAPIPAPAPDLTADRLTGALLTWFTSLSTTLSRHLPGLAVWDGADDRSRRAVEHLLTGALPAMARAHYQEAIRKLAADVPEFAIWMSQHEAAAVSRSLATLEHETATVSRGLRGLESALLRVTSHRDPQRHRAALARVYRGELGEPVLGGAAGDLAPTMPSLDDAYLDPRFRVRTGAPGPRPADEGWWGETEVRADFGMFLATYLTTPQAATAPLLLLGQPGGGKSSLTRILAARLPAADYLVVRVPLREVRAEAAIQDQIEQALRGTIGETVSWPDLARDADAAMPVVLLDGLDELLQVTGVHQSDYLERVAAFQHREARLGRPAAVLVTSRTAVADRARIPSGGVVARLEPFDAAQVDRWLTTWNEAHADHWARTGRRPLTRDVVLRFRDLAAQPLLLLMLALYDASTNALQDAEAFDTGQLYERLLHEFAEREVRRVHGVNHPQRVLGELVEAELLRLSVAAFAMFHRSRLWVTTEELDGDLAGLGLRTTGDTPGHGVRSPVTAGEEIIGRFFFIQRAQAFHDDQTRWTYEFLHATFGEYLVARLVVRAVRESARAAHTAAGDDDLLRSLLGYTPLCARATVLPFVEALLAHAGSADLRDWIVDRLRTAVTRPRFTAPAYRPVPDKREDHWMATYSFNLAVLALAAGVPVRASELFRYAKDPAAWLRDTALQWRAAVPSGMWLEALESVTVTRTWAVDGRRDMIIEAGVRKKAGALDPLWSLGAFPRSLGPDSFDAGVTDRFPVFEALTSMDLTGTFSDDALRHGAEPIAEFLSIRSLTTFVEHTPGSVESVANSLVRLVLASRAGFTGAGLAGVYDRAITAVLRYHPGDHATAEVRGWLDVILRSLADDARRMASADVYRLVLDVFANDHHPAGAYPLLLECLAAGRAGPDERYDRFARVLVGRMVAREQQCTIEQCLRLLAVLPPAPEWRLSELLEILGDRSDSEDVRDRLRFDRDLAARISSARARFDGYRAMPLPDAPEQW
ncbi:NACHT domain-containing protein [Actinoplanes utahensis]|uniref:NACHT domain-containing protein n=1 Tax=Actinoplanes utahensis TaxID=1869 RepID=UPI0007C76EE8|nr:hypothetical protein [Actinoplanes utahensis]GIF29839.1 hypothetical protein Aut01nite_28250 [Actinoplanes utahensis]